MPEGQRRLLVKIATAYYEDGLTQKAIGLRFGLSRIKVSRLLREAREADVVQIRIVGAEDGAVDLERALEARYGLDEVVIATPDTDRAPDDAAKTAGVDPGAVIAQDRALQSALGEVAARCLVRGLGGDETVALTWGTTLRAVVNALPPQDWPALRVVQALGGLGHPAADVYGADLVHRMAQAFGARARILAAPGIVARPEVRDALLADRQIADTLALATRADIALVGIGCPSPTSVVRQARVLRSETVAELSTLGAVGDIGLRFFDAEGQPVVHAINGRIIGLTLAQFAQVPRVIGVAGGGEKVQVVRAALRGGLIDVLVTDLRTARQLAAVDE